MLKSFTHYCDCYNGSHISGQNNIGSAWCIFHYSWIWGTQWGVLLASPLCCSNILRPRCLLRYMPAMPWVPWRWVFCFKVEPSIDSYVGVFYGFCFLLSGSHVGAIFTNGGLTNGFCNTQLFGVYPWQACVPPGDGLWPMLRVHWIAAPPTTLIGESIMLFIQLSPAIPSIWLGIQLWRLSRVTQSTFLPFMVGRDLRLQVVFHLMIELSPNPWWTLTWWFWFGNCVWGWWVTHIWSLVCFCAQLQIYFVFITPREKFSWW